MSHFAVGNRTSGSGRVLRRSWKNKRSRFTRRVRWYDNGQGSYRLELMDEHFEVNRWFTTEADAEALYERFIKLAAEWPPLQPGDKSVVKEAIGE